MEREPPVVLSLDEASNRHNRALRRIRGGVLFSRRLPMLLASSAILGACHSMSRVPQPTDGDGVYEIRFSPARTIDAHRADGSAVSLTAAKQLRVRTARTAGDSVTVHIAAWSAERLGVNELPAYDAEATFDRSDGGLSFYERRMSTKKNLLLAAVIVGGLALAAGQASIAGGSGSWNVGGYFKPRF